MDVDFFFGENCLLIVGDGDFSFSVALSRYPQFKAHNVTSSSLETESSIKIHALAVENIALLKSLGVSICLEVDARELHTHDVIGKHKYDRIIFNFPLADRHNIKKNRALLADFFSSCSHVLSSQGQAIVTLCKGQGGTPADQPMRSWHDSWQVVAMAANAGFVLQSVIPFESSQFPEYHSVGFRFQDKSFNTSGALSHIFELSELIQVQDTDSGVWGTVNYNDSVYSCSHYVATKMKRNLLTEPCNLVTLVKSRLESSLTDAFKSCVHLPSPLLLPGRRTLAYIVKENKVDGYPVNDCAEKSEFEMERKKQESLDKFERQTLIHGIENCGGERETYCDHDLNALLSLPQDNTAVYVLVKSSNETVNLSADHEIVHGEFCKASVNENSIEEANYHPSVDASNARSFEPDQPSPAFHHRVSLLENLPEICHEFITSSSCVLQGKGKRMDCVIAEPHIDCLRHLESLPCLITSGQCMQPGPICKNFTPVKQEFMLIHQIFDPEHFKRGLPTEPSTPYSICVHSSDLAILNKISASIVSAFSMSNLLSPAFNISLQQPCDSFKIVLLGVDQCVITNRILLQSQNSDDLYLKKPTFIGHTIYVCVGDCGFHITLMNITNFTCKLFGIKDERLLWCTQKKFLSQFKKDSLSSLRIVKPPSLYPLTFVHDISFWERDDTVFDLCSFYNIIRSVADDLVSHVSLVDTYIDPVSLCKSQCYRLHFQSCYQALAYHTSWKLQSRIRMEVAKILHVTLR